MFSKMLKYAKMSKEYFLSLPKREQQKIWLVFFKEVYDYHRKVIKAIDKKLYDSLEDLKKEKEKTKILIIENDELKKNLSKD